LTASEKLESVPGKGNHLGEYDWMSWPGLNAVATIQ
jgi:hypothetical protein